MEKKLSAAVFFLLALFIFSSQMVPQAEGRMCESQSHHYEGMCSGDHNCAMVCRTEAPRGAQPFSGGHCKGFRRRCFCTRTC